MIESIEWLRLFILHYPALEYIVILLGVGFGGELALFALGFLAAHDVISIQSLVIFSFLGTLSSDTLWFILGRTTFIKKIISHRYANTTISVVNEAVDKVSMNNHLIALILAKFLIGTRVLLIMYVSTKNIFFKEFIKYDLIAVLFWLSVIIPVGLLSGFGFTYLANILENIYVSVGFILLIIILIIVLEIWIKNKFTKLAK